MPLSHFSEIYQSSVREMFARLTQMATILCFESVEEMSDYWRDERESINWRLSPAEIETILKLRRDFSEANISAFALTMLSVPFLVPDDDASRRQEIDRTSQRLAELRAQPEQNIKTCHDRWVYTRQLSRTLRSL